MKLHFTFLVILALCISCKEKTKSDLQIIQESIENKLLPNMHDPESYEFVSIEVDTATFEKFYDSKIESAKTIMETLEGFPSATQYKREYDSLIIVKNDADNLNEIHSINGVFSSRGNNAFGAKILNKYRFVLSPELEIIRFEEID